MYNKHGQRGSLPILNTEEGKAGISISKGAAGIKDQPTGMKRQLTERDLET